MANVVVVGSYGKMGSLMCNAIKESKNYNLLYGVDILADGEEKNIYNNLDIKYGLPDVIIDFSNADALVDIIDFAVFHNTKLIIATTGHSECGNKLVTQASEKIAIFKSENFSFGMNVLVEELKTFSKKLIGYDTEILECHKKYKKDYPSGTAIMLKNIIKQHSINSPAIIPIHSIRIGDVAGMHTIIFGGTGELIELKHTVLDRSVFVNGVIKALYFIQNKSKGLYNMNDLIKM
ncbi:MAG: dihydrodipicolinate reductase C-terminal domain-containing protein [Clostridia bacterium]|jgi:4-hydroxy-tetrahydrodipicolinate reductase|nr:4-hydroxy-tetrahydrodipicolinate reductase [Clostridia bacterium]MDD4275677.1 dihydrodipicolinate reductase C-terminal domain-containing protein [Clostridia bacterium]